MNTKSMAMGALVIAALHWTPARAALFTAEPDAFAVGTDLGSAYTGVTLSILGTGFGVGPVRAVNPSTQPIEPFTASTGSLTFGHNGAFLPHLFREPTTQALRADFVTTAISVSIDFVSNDFSDLGFLQAFGAGDVLLGTYTTASLAANAFETMTLSGVGPIAYVIASGLNASSSGGLDNLRWETAATAVPEPGTLALVGIGLAGLVAAGRRSRR